jgi:hypothetical protein
MLAMPTLTRRHLLAGAAATAACAAMPAAAAIEAVGGAPVMEVGSLLMAGGFDPLAAIGDDGDFYIDVTNGNVWNKVVGAWKLVYQPDETADQESA